MSGGREIARERGALSPHTMEGMRRRGGIAAAVVVASAYGCALDLDGTAGVDAGLADVNVADVSVPGVDAARAGDATAAGDAWGSDAFAGDGAVVADANKTDATMDGGVVRDAAIDASPSADPGIRCGSTFCSASSSFCCKQNGQYDCLSVGTTCSGAPIYCDDRVECAASSICCAHLDGQGRLARVDCVGSSSCNGNATQLCDPDASTCPSGTTCQPASSELQGFFDCN